MSVIICDLNNYPTELNIKYQEYFDLFSYELSPFQKYSIEALIEGHHSLVTAATGSGKSLPAEFAIQFFTKLNNKKVIYCSPIKALSNQKYNEFKQKYPDISFGIITGDIKENLNANVIIATTEILLNKLQSIKSTSSSNINQLFDIDIEKDVACVIFDEIHYINDKDRGYVWEQSLMLLPQNIQLLMLSATIEAPEKFADWVQQRYKDEPKNVYLSGTDKRIVPLIHNGFITVNEGFFKKLKDKPMEAEIRKIINKPIVIKNSKNIFLEENFSTLKKTLNLFENKNIYVNRSFALNQLLKYMFDNDLFNAICFVFSRKMLETLANEVTTNILEDDSKTPYIVRRESEQILRNLPNFEEYINTPEYLKLILLLEKGIGIHHAGMLSIYRELVEILFLKGFIKILFATETFSVGINAPTRSVIFTDIEKYSDDGIRLLYPHEYNQMSGRAGRRGFDNVGHVFHLNNLIKTTDTTAIRIMMQGKPQKLASKFKISYNLILNNPQDALFFVNKSMMGGEIELEISGSKNEIAQMEKTINILFPLLISMKVPLDILQEYIILDENKKGAINKTRKQIEKKLLEIEMKYRIMTFELDSIKSYNKKVQELEKAKHELNSLENFLETNIKTIQTYLGLNNYIDVANSLTIQGNAATHLKEVNCILWAPLLVNRSLSGLTPIEIVGIVSCFLNIKIKEDMRLLSPSSKNATVNRFGLECSLRLINIIKFESDNALYTGLDNEIQYDLIDLVMDWCESSNVEECKVVLQKLDEFGIFLGDFAKNMLSLVNICLEFEMVAELIGDVELLYKLKEIPSLIMKYIVANQTLYIL